MLKIELIRKQSTRIKCKRKLIFTRESSSSIKKAFGWAARSSVRIPTYWTNHIQFDFTIKNQEYFDYVS